MHAHPTLVLFVASLGLLTQSTSACDSLYLIGIGFTANYKWDPIGYGTTQTYGDGCYPCWGHGGDCNCVDGVAACGARAGCAPRAKASSVCTAFGPSGTPKGGWTQPCSECQSWAKWGSRQSDSASILRRCQFTCTGNGGGGGGNSASGACPGNPAYATVQACQAAGGKKCNKRCRNSNRDVDVFYESSQTDDEFVAGINWVLGGGGESCDVVCASEHMGCDGVSLHGLHNQDNICVNTTGHDVGKAGCRHAVICTDAQGNAKGVPDGDDCPNQDDTATPNPNTWASKNGHRQLKAFEHFGIDCNGSHTTSVYDGSDTFPAFAKLRHGQDANECHLNPDSGECNGDAACLCGSQPPEIPTSQFHGDDGLSHPFVMHRLCACSETAHDMEATRDRLAEHGLVFDSSGVQCAPTPAAAAPKEPEESALSEGEGDAVVALGVIVAILAVVAVVLLYLLFNIKKKVQEVQMKQMAPANA